MLAVAVGLCHAAHASIVTDSLSTVPLPRVSIFDKNGNVIGMTADDGSLPTINKDSYPLTLSYIGFSPVTVSFPPPTLITMNEKGYTLPEVVVDSRKHSILHLTAYVREYSTLSTDYDTVQLFREKTVDFMIPAKRVKNFRGWFSPRILASESYYRFTNFEGLDSVSNRFRQHFSWSDWIGLLPETSLPAPLTDTLTATYTIEGRYLPTEIWRRDGDNVSLDIDALAAPETRKWVPLLADFDAKNVEFDQFNVKYRFSDVYSDALFPSDISSISFNISSIGRGRNMRSIFHTTDPVKVDTYAEIYVTDREYLTVSEARKWEKEPPLSADIGINAPADAPPLQPSIRSLIARVDGIDYDALKLTDPSDPLMKGNKNFDKVITRGPLIRRIGKKVWDMLKR